MAKLKIGGFDITTKDSLTWGDMEDFQRDIGGAIKPDDVLAGIESTHQLLEKIIISIKKGGEEVAYSNEWLRSLEFSDATSLIEEATAFLKKVQGVQTTPDN